MTSTTPDPIPLPTLYRGDSLPPAVISANAKVRGRTWADHYVTEGLLAKANSGAFSGDLARPLEQLVALHVGYRVENRAESHAAYYSPLISFSTEEAGAWHFVDRTAKRTFTACRLDEATHFLWKLSGVLARLVAPGHFRFEFLASTANVDRFRDQLVAAVHGGDLSRLHSALATQIVHGHVRADKTIHVADLIDVPTFLKGLDAAKHAIEPEVLSRACQYGTQWKEWLLYPMDYEPDVRGFSSRFPVNEHLDLHVFARQTAR